MIVDDEPKAVNLLEVLVGQATGWQLLAKCYNGLEAIAFLKNNEVDLVFLDIQMPGLSGLDVAKEAAGRAHVVFVTAYDQHAIAAFDQGAVDYVMKPISLARLASTVQRLKARIAEPPADLSGILASLTLLKSESRSYLRWVNASVGATIKLITVDEICFFKADSKYTLVATQSAESLIRKTIKELTDELDPQQFWQIHRSTLINARAIAGITRDERGRQLVSIKGRPEKLEVSRSYAHLFKGM